MVGSSRTTVPFVTVPLYKNEAEHIAMEMAGYSVEELSGMLGINRNLALQTKERYNVFHSPDVHGLPALLAYTGIVFRYISPADFTEADFEYAQNHLRMASACYGLTRPLDVIKPYRMEYTVELPSFNALATNVNTTFSPFVKFPIDHLPEVMSNVPFVALYERILNAFGINTLAIVFIASLGPLFMTVTV